MYNCLFIIKGTNNVKLAHSSKKAREIRNFTAMFNSLQLAICIAIILRPVSFARRISLEVSPKKTFLFFFFKVGPRGKISFKSFTKNYSYHCYYVFYFHNIALICRSLRKMFLGANSSHLKPNVVIRLAIKRVMI